PVADTRTSEHSLIPRLRVRLSPGDGCGRNGVNAARWSMVAPGGDMRKPPGARGPGGFACGRERARSAGYPYGEGVADLGRAACGQVTAVREVGGDGVLDARGLGLVAEVAQQEGDGQDGGRRVGLALAGDVRGRAVHGREHGGERTRRVDVPAGGDADAAGDGRGEVGDDVAEEVVGDDDVEAGRVGDEVDRRGVDVDVVGGDVGVLLGHPAEDVGPQVAREGQHVVLVDQRQLLAGAGLGAGEGVADHALDAEGRV